MVPVGFQIRAELLCLLQEEVGRTLSAHALCDEDPDTLSRGFLMTRLYYNMPTTWYDTT
jgi:hypothetical protein